MKMFEANENEDCRGYVKMAGEPVVRNEDEGIVMKMKKWKVKKRTEEAGDSK